jgi:hypothetical protein
METEAMAGVEEAICADALYTEDSLDPESVSRFNQINDEMEK